MASKPSIWDPKQRRPHVQPAGKARLLSRAEIRTAYPGVKVTGTPCRKWQLTYRGKEPRNRFTPG